MDNYIHQQNSNKDIAVKKLPTQTNQKMKKNIKNKNEKDIFSSSVKTRRKPRFINSKKNYFDKKKLKSYSRYKKIKNKQNIKNRLIILPKPNMNKTICTDGYGNISNVHDRNLSAPSLNYQKNEEKKLNNNYNKKNIIKKKKNNIIQLNLGNRAVFDENLMNKDNLQNHIQLDINSIKNNNNENISLNEEKIFSMRCNNNEQIDSNIFNNSKNNDESDSLMKMKTLPEEDNNYINIHKNHLNIKNFYKNINNKKQNYIYNSKIDLSSFNKDIETIKNTRETIAMLKEKLKMQENYYYNYIGKPKMNKTINTLNCNNIDDQISHGPLNKYKKKINKNYNRINLVNKNEYGISNFHNYNQITLNKNNKSKNYIDKINNTLFIDSNNNSKDLTPSNQVAYTTRENNNIINLSNSSNNKTVTISTNITNNNNGFSKKLNLSSVSGGHNDEEKDIKENNNTIKTMNNQDNNNIEQLNSNKNKNENSDKNDENNISQDVSNYKNQKLDNNYNDNYNNSLIKNDNNNNIIKNNKNNNEINKKQNCIYLQKSNKTKDNNYLNKNINQFPLNIKNKNNNNIKEKNKEKDNNNQQVKYKSRVLKINKNNHINNNNKNIEINSKYNSNNSERHNNFNNIHIKNKSKENNKKDNISYDIGKKKKESISKKKLSYVSKSKEKKIKSNLKKNNSYQPNIKKKKLADKVSDETINLSTNKVKRHSTKCNFKYKSIYKIGVVCEAGEVVFGEKKTNQDDYFNSLINNDMRFIGVCDGHGEHGHHVSKYLRENLPKELEKAFKKFFKKEDIDIDILQKEMSILNNKKINTEENKINNTNIFDTIKKIFEKSFSKTDNNLSLFCQNLKKKYKKTKNFSEEDDENIFNVEYSGSTCVSILLKEKNINKIYIANVGDSRAIIIKELQNQNKDWVPYQLSRDHKPTEEDEAQRILEYDGEIEKIEDDDGNWTGPLRVWVKGSDGPGLAMTRSFGDEIGATVGVFSVPEITEYKIKEEDRVIIIASDGLWEYMDNKEVTEIVKKLIKQKDPDIIVKKLYKESVVRWKLNDQGIDDITIICILLKSN